MRKEPIIKAIDGYKRQIDVIESDISKHQKDIQILDEKVKSLETQKDVLDGQIQSLKESMNNKVSTIQDMLNHKFEVSGKLQATEDFAKELLD